MSGSPAGWGSRPSDPSSERLLAPRVPELRQIRCRVSPVPRFHVKHLGRMVELLGSGGGGGTD